ncbi:uncharacterized protein L969DRAFT_54237 [Mixia osmundae IAM 14324]|uniref:Magnesium transporter n=1 Tax=Mixia osmundae (strain CBS 9802 / IAM 14324 / JCM 22182 / KY 12970) TaxID=764103 RepID=G7E2P9_MIXOS|nr:uncharacterized protein L969DRAFT_54237 [Mixia osmundae IAM 14324]KEI36974.1 hypothetical protein L969DRAFT_54237 [Mixia osmundae IAM 14324]GAA97109.1 hypothetical protein E5Q_03784 [Mixia osmundae IAM 14324]
MSTLARRGARTAARLRVPSRAEPCDLVARQDTTASLARFMASVTFFVDDNRTAARRGMCSQKRLFSQSAGYLASETVTQPTPIETAASPAARRASASARQRLRHGAGKVAPHEDLEMSDKMLPLSLASTGNGGAKDSFVMKCTILDKLGNVKTISGSYKKTEICTEHCLQARDLRKLDSRVPNVVPTFLVRKSAILVNILHVRALIKRDEVWLFESTGLSSSSGLYSTFLYHLEGNLRHSNKGGNSLPYEFRALDSMLHSAMSALESEVVNVRDLVLDLLESLESDIVADRLRVLLQFSRKLAALQKRAKSVQDAINEVLDQDEDMAGMYLSDRRTTDDHSEIEMLLESYGKQAEEIVSEVDGLVANVSQTQDVIELILDARRNALLALDLKVSIATMGLGSGALITGALGMNLATGLESDPRAFGLVFAGAIGLSGLVAVLGIRKVRQLRRVGLGRLSSAFSNVPRIEHQ